MKKALLILAAALGLSACASQVPGQVKVTGGTIQGEIRPWASCAGRRRSPSWPGRA